MISYLHDPNINLQYLFSLKVSHKTIVIHFIYGMLGLVLFINFIYWRIFSKRNELDLINNINLSIYKGYLLLFLFIFIIILLYLKSIFEIKINYEIKNIYILYIINKFIKLLYGIDYLLIKALQLILKIKYFLKLREKFILFLLKLKIKFDKKLNIFIIIVFLYMPRIILSIVIILDYFIYNKLYYLFYSGIIIDLDI